MFKGERPLLQFLIYASDFIKTGIAFGPMLA
jgi:hypothetical protein